MATTATAHIATDFVPWDGEYEKEFYDVLLPSGEVVKHCWPNAGFMNDIMGNGPQRQWSPKDGVKVRPSPDHPMDS